MKVFLCKTCQDIVRPYPDEIRSCHCRNIQVQCDGEVKVKVLTKNRNNVVPIGLHNTTFREAVLRQPEVGWGVNFTAFVIPKNVMSITYESPEETPMVV